ncbi:cytochrome o ubiquinol oxidase subunit IV [Vibrio sp. vnigr-6D03]|uniref:Cytochrome bo(3) ubiquinol oxidase subunit 4 n=1 Tax=Vibrio penaeicida TaxID=104609 RepID=A0AAV5NYD9_9VIBR|nr:MULTISPECIES: cytochrome o ubiquinol oxidase subunit IV [Vibrio]MDP2571199.1 cytochrome o ubiquinol oxidase subunit IV [Vibrio penaeicida]PKF76805.1 cytochrome o ubiquinol oxidase subunit IV [Vibrio sp. vnigr-6D03]RTZ22961.1 cytochrome o ubiquinol oxidase subunit IV [Vibrio penaeicida]GLQ75393.1 cytochrome o ubiquinol oxidase subunit IV [Vibrio penaeicida]
MAQTAEHGHGGQAHGSVKEYVMGLIYSVLLTVIPFAMVMMDIGSPQLKIGVILICAVAQILVQLVFFLHMNTSSEQMWNTTSAVFVVVLVAIILIGSLWIMEHLNHNMLMGH